MKKVFISYSHADYLDDNNNIKHGSAVDKIVETLKANSIEVIIDIERRKGGDEYMLNISNWIKQSDFILFISSKNSNSKDSYWPVKEVSCGVEEKKRIIPISIDGTKYNDKIKVPLSGCDIIKYNSDKALEKLVVSINGKSEVVKPKKQWREIVKGISKISLIFLGVILSFITIGCIWGYYTTKVEAEDLVNIAMTHNSFSLKDSGIIHYNDEDISFDYSIETGRIIDDTNAFGVKIFDFKRVYKASAPAALIPAVIGKVGNGKSKFVVSVVVIVGYYSGFIIGNYWGEQFANMKNKEELEKFLNNHRKELEKRILDLKQ